MAVGVLRGGGDVNAALIIDNAPLWLGTLPAMAILGLVLKVPNEIFCLCLMLEYILKSPLGLIRLRSGKWIHDITKIGIKKRKGTALPLFYAFAPLPRRSSRSSGTLTHSDESTKSAMPIMRFVLMCSSYTATAKTVARTGLTR